MQKILVQLHPALLRDPELADLKWHTHAQPRRSSQTFCVNAFCRLRQLAVRDRILDEFFRASFGSGFTIPTHKEWLITPEVSEVTLLGEVGGQATAKKDIQAFARKTPTLGPLGKSYCEVDRGLIETRQKPGMARGSELAQRHLSDKFLS